MGLAIGRPDKPTEEAGLLCLRDADALIPNTDERLLPLWHHLQCNLDRHAGWAVLDGVGEQIDQHLFDASPIHLCHEVRQRRGECELVAVATLPHLGEHAPNGMHEIDGLPVQQQPPCLQADHIEQV